MWLEFPGPVSVGIPGFKYHRAPAIKNLQVVVGQELAAVDFRPPTVVDAIGEDGFRRRRKGRGGEDLDDLTQIDETCDGGSAAPFIFHVEMDVVEAVVDKVVGGCGIGAESAVAEVPIDQKIRRAGVLKVVDGVFVDGVLRGGEEVCHRRRPNLNHLFNRHQHHTPVVRSRFKVPHVAARRFEGQKIRDVARVDTRQHQFRGGSPRREVREVNCQRSAAGKRLDDQIGKGKGVESESGKVCI